MIELRTESRIYWNMKRLRRAKRRRDIQQRENAVDAIKTNRSDANLRPDRFEFQSNVLHFMLAHNF